MNCHTFSTGLSSGHLGGSAMMVMLAGTTRRVDMCQPAWSTKRTAWAAGATAAAISARCRFIASVLYQPAETLTHRRHRLRRARCQYPIGLPYVFAMDVPVGRRQHESGSASFGISPANGLEFIWCKKALVNVIQAIACSDYIVLNP